MAQGMDLLARLCIAKARALLHDPPYKSICISERVEGRDCNHENEAKWFREQVFGGTPLAGYAVEEYDSVARDADVMAAGFDRWILGPYERTGLVGLNVIANVFDPRYLGKLPEMDLNEARKRAEQVAKELNKVIKSATESLRDESEKVELAYLLLYALYEPLCLLNGLTSLADTRVPTHTVFDHVYATASMVNLVLYRGDKPLRGFLVLVDFPGVHEFVDAARKAGDFWAGSWLVSNAMWRLAEKLIDDFGPDVLLAPTPRFNPYFYYRYVLGRLERAKKGCGSRDAAERIEKVAERVRDIVDELFEKLSGAKLSAEDWLRQPLVPATMLFVLPKGVGWTSSAREVADKLLEKFREAWGELVREIKDALKTPQVQEDLDLINRIVLRILDESKLVEEPPMGLRVTVVDMEELFKKLVSCFSGNPQECVELGLEPSAAELASKFGEGKAGELARIIAFYVAASAYLSRLSPLHVPTPNSFWVFADEKLKPRFQPWVLAGEELEPEPQPDCPTGRTPRSKCRGLTDWIPCSQCGAEPAVLVLRKRRVVRMGVPEVDFREDDLERLLKRAGFDAGEIKKLKSDESFRSYLRTHFRPGEALGPYCVLKRATYLCELKKRGRAFVSTDDVALGLYSDFLAEKLGKGFEAKIAQRLAAALGGMVDLYAPALQSVIGGGTKDIEVALALLALAGTRVRLETFASKVAEALAEYVLESHCKERKEKARDFALDLLLRASPKDIARDVRKLLEVASGEVQKPALAGILRPRTSYAIVYADADNIGRVHRGELHVSARDYAKSVLDLIRKHGKARPETLEALERGFEAVAYILRAMHGDRRAVVVSPALKVALSAALVLTALKDTVTVERRLAGVVVYAGGDDLIALVPVDAVAYTPVLRGNYAGDNFFHKLDGLPVVSAVPLGRSMSVRVANLMDIMSDEISRASQALEEYAKSARWSARGKEWEKDALAITFSRTGAVAVFPLSLPERGDTLPEPVHCDILRVLSGVYASLMLGILSSNVPEDFESFAGGATRQMPPQSREVVARYVFGRNLTLRVPEGEDKKKVAEEWLSNFISLESRGLKLFFDVTRESTPLVEDLVRAIRIMRVMV